MDDGVPVLEDLLLHPCLEHDLPSSISVHCDHLVRVIVLDLSDDPGLLLLVEVLGVVLVLVVVEEGVDHLVGDHLDVQFEGGEVLDGHALVVGLVV